MEEGLAISSCNPGIVKEMQAARKRCESDEANQAPWAGRDARYRLAPRKETFPKEAAASTCDAEATIRARGAVADCGWPCKNYKARRLEPDVSRLPAREAHWLRGEAGLICLAQPCIYSLFFFSSETRVY